ncbi:MAG: hypothetical protein HC929_19635, partial [Leptolyngbyaceae cyanobacterium SM2_5_2]|nr:hypothetical protein [Leptolyngbyaceae cyanobacterium SM2_5_2]
MAKVYSTALLLLTGLAITLIAGSCIAASRGQAQESARITTTNQAAVSASAESISLLRQATLADPRLQQMVQEYRQQFGVEAHLEVGAVAAVAYYGLA